MGEVNGTDTGRGVLVMVTGRDAFRAVLHLQVSRDDVEEAVGAANEVVPQSLAFVQE